MKLSQIIINGFRNFKDATINVNEKTLIIGANDIGKSNLLYAVRLLLDRTISESDLEPSESDFYVYDSTINELRITLKFTDIDHEAVRSKLGKLCSDEDELYIQYRAFKNTLEYELRAGCSIDNLEELQGRFYLKVLNLKYIGSNRDFNRYINKERKKLIHEAKEERTDAQKTADTTLLTSINTNLSNADTGINNLSFVKKSTEMVDSELRDLSFHHSSQKVVFDAGSTDVNKFIDSLSIASEINGERLKIGGDGRNNQIFLALWSAQNEMGKNSVDEYSIYCIEEPEAHLHPHQQRKLSEYLSAKSTSQIFITSHSPHIATEFSPNSIVRLKRENNSTIGASNGCSAIIEDEFFQFGYRINTIATEAFFADVVFLVEGPSEVVFYKALAKQKGLDLDHYNISIIMVDGVGFKRYVKILNSLGIKWVIRTDNDIFKVPNTPIDTYRLAGVERGISIVEELYSLSSQDQGWFNTRKSSLRWTGSRTSFPQSNLTTTGEITSCLQSSFNIFIALNDLENDVVNLLAPQIYSALNVSTSDEAIEHLKAKKATNMFEFVFEDIKKGDHSIIKAIPDTAEIVKPLSQCKFLAEQVYA